LKILPETLFRASCGIQKVVYAQEKFPEAAFDAANVKNLLKTEVLLLFTGGLQNAQQEFQRGFRKGFQNW
jgi:hypothetical protein